MTNLEKDPGPGQARDVYEQALLVAGRDRVVDVALVELVETGRVRVQRSGTVTLVDGSGRHPAERRLLDLLPPDRPTTLQQLRRRAVRGDWTREEQPLRDRGLLSDSPLVRALARFGHDVQVTRAGRAARTGRPRSTVTTGPSAGIVAAGGLAALPDLALRAALTGWPEPAVRSRRSSWSGSSAGVWSSWTSSGCGGGGGCGGGSGCGGGGGGCGGGGGGCGGGGG
jgi:uncharacterized protein (TIGR04222 family)